MVVGNTVLEDCTGDMTFVYVLCFLSICVYNGMKYLDFNILNHYVLSVLESLNCMSLSQTEQICCPDRGKYSTP